MSQPTARICWTCMGGHLPRHQQAAPQRANQGAHEKPEPCLSDAIDHQPPQPTGQLSPLILAQSANQQWDQLERKSERVPAHGGLGLAAVKGATSNGGRM